MEQIRHVDMRHLLLAALLGVFFAITAVTASLAHTSLGALGGVENTASTTLCLRRYAGRCSPDNPCGRPDLRNWRYGDERDFSCFIYQRN